MHEKASACHGPIGVQNGSDRLFGILALHFICLKVALAKTVNFYGMKIHHGLE
jgi:hypothetical protein